MEHFLLFSFQTGKKSSLHTWQLKTIGVEAEVLFSKATIWSKHSSSGAWSWLTGILRASTLETLKIKHVKKGYSLICVFKLIHISLQLLYCPYCVAVFYRVSHIEMCDCNLIKMPRSRSKSINTTPPLILNTQTPSPRSVVVARSRPLQGQKIDKERTRAKSLGSSRWVKISHMLFL